MAFAVIALCALTWWLTPDRLTRIVNEKASQMINADVRASDIRFTLWSTFPHLDIELDSLHVRSRNFDSIPASLRAQLPADADFLLSTSHARGGINLLKLIGGRIWLRDVQVDSLKVNLVDATDSLNNYNVTHSQGATKIPYFNIDKMSIARGGNVKYTSLPSNSVAEVSLTKAGLMPTGVKNRYNLTLDGSVYAASDGLVILNGFPFGLAGEVNVRFKPFGIQTSDYRVALGSIDGRMSVDMDLGGDVQLNTFNYRLQDFTLADLYQMIPAGSFPVLKKISADLSVNCTARLTTPYNFASAYLPSVNVDFSVPDGEITYSLSDSRRYTVKKVKINGTLVFDGQDPAASYIEIPEILLEGGGATLIANAKAVDLTNDPMISANVSGNVNLARAARVVSELKPYHPSGDLEFKANLGYRVADSMINGNLLATSKKMEFTTPGNNTDIAISGLTAKWNPGRQKVGELLRVLKLNVAGKRADIRQGGTSLAIADAKVDLTASRLAHPQTVPDYAAPASWNADARTLGFAEHTPELIRVNVSDAMHKLMQNWKADLALKVASASMHTPGYKTPTTMKDLDLTASFDSVTLRHAALNSGCSGGEVSAKLTNLRQFLSSHTPAPLKLAMNLRFDTIQINQLAKAYAAAHPEAMGDSAKALLAADARHDTVAYLIPRNLFADVDISAAQTRYINLHLYDLVGHLSAANGVASVDNMHIAADFGNADLRLKYNTADMQNMCVEAAFGLNDVNVVGFFNNFHSLLEMMPQMKNLSGMLSADVKGRVRIFPNMNLIVPSLWANGYIEGWDLKVHQNHFVRNITRMLLIPDSNDLEIADMKVHAGIHSNLLEVFPFIFEVEKYKLCLGGLNNFNGDLYYHIGVEDWPLKFPFGINVKGTYSHPELKFGGKEWHDSNGAKITAGVQDYDHINLVEKTRKYSGEFIHTAANYEGN